MRVRHHPCSTGTERERAGAAVWPVPLCLWPRAPRPLALCLSTTHWHRWAPHLCLSDCLCPESSLHTRRRGGAAAAAGAAARARVARTEGRAVAGAGCGGGRAGAAAAACTCVGGPGRPHGRVQPDGHPRRAVTRPGCWHNAHPALGGPRWCAWVENAYYLPAGDVNHEVLGALNRDLTATLHTPRFVLG